MVKSRNYSQRRTLAEIRRRKHLRRKIEVWCARFVVLAVMCLMIGLVGAMVHGFVSLANEAIQARSYTLPEVTSQQLETVIEVENLHPSESLTEGYITEKQEAEVTTQEVTTTAVPMPESELSAEEEVPTQEVTTTSVPLPEPELSAYEAGEMYYYEFSYEDKVLIAKTVYLEARGESFEGQVAVAAVVINRYFSDDTFFENDSIYSVVTQNCQFADISGVTEANLADYPSCLEAVEAACKGWDPTREVFPETGATYFYEPEGLGDYQRSIRTGITEMIIGNHHFHIDFNLDAVN